MKKLLFLLLLSPVAYSSSTLYCDTDIYNYLKLEHNYWTTKKNTDPRFNVTYGNKTNTNFKDFYATTESINETFFGITAFDDENKSLYSFNIETNILIISYLDSVQEIKKDTYNTQKEKLIDGRFAGGHYSSNKQYKCKGIVVNERDKRNAKDMPSEAPFLD
jgi:hypothetical protein